MIFELIYLLSIMFAGCALMHIVGFKGWALPAVGFATGIALQVIVGTIQAITSLPSSPFITLVIIVLLPAIVLVWFYIRSQAISIKIIPAILTILIVVLSALLLRNIVSVTPDSFEYIAIGSLLNSGNFNEASPNLLMTRMLAVPLIHAPANINGEFYFRSISPMIALTTLAITYWLCIEGLNTSLKDLRFIKSFSVIGVFLLLTNNRFVFNAFYINGHMLTALFLLLLVGSAWLMARNASISTNSLLLIQVISIPVLTFTRPENSLFLGLVMLPILLTNRIASKYRAILLLVLGLSITIWHGFLWIKFAGDQGHVPVSVLGMFCLGIIALIVAPLLTWRQLDRRLSSYPALPSLIELVLWLVLFVFVLINPVLFKNSIIATVHNVILDTGGWGVSLVMLGIIVVVVLVFTDTPDRIILRFPLTAFFPLAFLLAYLRGGAYRIAYADSLNRMFIHILPLAVLLVVSSAATGSWNIPIRLKRIINQFFT